jgi:hypothetical protein
LHHLRNIWSQFPCEFQRGLGSIDESTAASFVGCWADTPQQASTQLEQLFRENSRVIKLSEQKLTGDGVDFLLAETTGAQFVCIAEPHNVREIPKFVTALFDLLQLHRGYHYLAIEQGPFITGQIGKRVSEKSNEEIQEFAKQQRRAVHFRTVEEVTMIADVASLSEGSISGVWGLDRVLDRSYLIEYLASEAGRSDPQREFLRRRADWSEDNLARYGADRNSEAGRYWSLTDYQEFQPLANVGDPHQWVLVDLRPARSPLREGKFKVSKKLGKFVEDFDAVLLLGGGSRGRRL